MTAGVTQPLILTPTSWPNQLPLRYCCLDYASSLEEWNTTLSPLPPGRSVRPTLSHVVSAVISPSRVCRDSVARVFRIPTDGSGKSHIYQSRSYSVIRPRDLAVPRVWYCEEVLRTLSCALRGSPGSPQMAQAKAIYIKVGVTTGLGHKTPWPCSSTRRYYGPALSHCVR